MVMEERHYPDPPSSPLSVLACDALLSDCRLTASAKDVETVAVCAAHRHFFLAVLPDQVLP
jgi:hypothetical protein